MNEEVKLARDALFEAIRNQAQLMKAAETAMAVSVAAAADVNAAFAGSDAALKSTAMTAYTAAATNVAAALADSAAAQTLTEAAKKHLADMEASVNMTHVTHMDANIRRPKRDKRYRHNIMTEEEKLLTKLPEAQMPPPPPSHQPIISQGKIPEGGRNTKKSYIRRNKRKTKHFKKKTKRYTKKAIRY